MIHRSKNKGCFLPGGLQPSESATGCPRVSCDSRLQSAASRTATPVTKSRFKKRQVLLLLGVVVVLAAGAVWAVQKPMIVVLDFTSTFDDGRMGRKVASIARKHAFLRRTYQTMDDFTLNELLAESKFFVLPAMGPEEIGKAAKEKLSADILLWGTIEKLGGDDYRLTVKGVDTRSDPPKMIIDKSYICDGVHEIPQNVDAALSFIEGKGPKPEVDLMADDSWKRRRNLVKNGGFELGKETPLYWERVNGLTSFYVDGESPTGKCVMFDTDVLLSEWEEWKPKFEAGAKASEAPKKTPPKDPGYDTVGGTVGAHLYSDPIPIKPGMTYRLDFDLKGMAGDTSRVFVKGYAHIDDTRYPGKDADLVSKMLEKETGHRIRRPGQYGAQDREVYRAPVTLRLEKTGEWTHFCRLLRPTQCLLVLDFVSTFDGGATGRKVANAIYMAGKASRTFGVFDARRVKDALAARKIPVTPKSEAPEIALFAGEEFGHAIVIYGYVVETESGALAVFLKSLDVRRKVWDPLFQRTYRTTKDKLNEMAKQVISDLRKGKPVVKFLRIKLDCYWPRGKYYFDNVTLTEEGMGK